MTEYVFHTLEANFAEIAAEYGLKTRQVASWIW